MAKPERASSDVIVVTGASGGIGRATAVAFARRGMRVALLARGREQLDGARREVEAAGGAAFIVEVDMADSDAVFAAALSVENELGPIRVWVNNAMATIFAPVGAITPADFKRATEVTYLGAVYGTMAALKHMTPRRRGTIVQIGSALAYRAIPLQAPYFGAKHALRGFTNALRCELLHDKSPIHLTMVQLAAFNTPQFSWSRNVFRRRPQPVPPIFQPELAAEAIVWAAYHRKREVWVGGPTYKAIIANKFLPGLLDEYLAHNAYDSQFTGEKERSG
ncbi:MAG: SDR family oxidoreductase, partial [Terracidiphilus sp.]